MLGWRHARAQEQEHIACLGSVFTSDGLFILICCLQDRNSSLAEWIHFDLESREFVDRLTNKSNPKLARAVVNNSCQKSIRVERKFMIVRHINRTIIVSLMAPQNYLNKHEQKTAAASPFVPRKTRHTWQRFHIARRTQPGDKSWSSRVCHMYRARSTFQALCKALLINYCLPFLCSVVIVFGWKRFENKKKTKSETFSGIFHKYFLSIPPYDS